MNNLLARLTKVRELTVFIFLVAVFVLVGIINPTFITFDNIMLTLKGSVMYIFLAIGMTFVILTKDIDVSVGAILGICAAVCATLLRANRSLFEIITITLLVGAFAGFINGFGVTKLHVPAIVMTLGTMGVLRGLMFVYTGGKWVENLPDYFKKASQADLFGALNIFVVVTILIVIAIQIYMTTTKGGKYFPAIGDNIDGATLIGIPVTGIRILAFMISGVCSAMAGIVFVSQVGFVGNVAGNGTEMTAIAACVLGGVSLNGGIGSILGASMGAIIMNSINSALVFLKVPAYWNDTISGTLLIVIVVIDALIHAYFSDKAKKARLTAKFSVVEEKANG